MISTIPVNGFGIKSIALLLAVTGLAQPALASSATWCGKHYLPGDPVVAPKGRFSDVPEAPSHRLQCLPRIQPLTQEDDCDSIAILTRIEEVLGSNRVIPANVSALSLDIDIEGHNVLRLEHIEATSSGTFDHEAHISICSTISPRRAPFNLSCRAHVAYEYRDGHGQRKAILDASSTLFYLPPPRDGSSVTKLDRKTGGMLVQAARSGRFEPIFPIGFYTDFGGYLAKNLTILDELKEQGFNVVHPVPPFDDTDALDAVLDRMDEIGLYLMYDMRHSYQDLQALTDQVARIKHRKSLLLWYTADEPDGPGDPPAAARAAYDTIYARDGYHPVALALNCADYFFAEYVAAADIILPDVYMIGVNASFSVRYRTPCTRDFGCCGCDGCAGRVGDLRRRLDDANGRLGVLGWGRTRVVWAVTQAFGGEEFWSRPPTGREWLVQAVVSINHGARGIIPWLDPAPSDIKHAASRLARVLPEMTRFLLHPDAVFARHLPASGTLDVDVDIDVDADVDVDADADVDAASWRVGAEVLWLATNLANDGMSRSVAGAALPLVVAAPAEGVTAGKGKGKALVSYRYRWLLSEDAVVTPDGVLEVGPLGSAIVVISELQAAAQPQSIDLEHDEL